MAGLAKTDKFMLSTASVMIGAQEDLHDLNPTDHGLGLVKNFTFTSEPTYTDLMQGVKGSVVFSTMTANPVRASMEVYEYTARNIAYANGLDGSAINPMSVNSTLSAAVVALDVVLNVTSATGFLAGDVILIDKNGDDDFVIRRIVSIATNVITVDQPLPAIPTGRKVSKVNAIDIGSKDDQPFLSAKVAGKLANGTPTVILIPKMRITRGFTAAFSSDNYGNLPFEMTLYDLVATDPNFALFGGAQAQYITI